LKKSGLKIAPLGKPSSSITRKPTKDSTDSGGDREERSSIFVQLSRLDLFIDLIWVGIIGNLSATYSEQAFGDSGVSIGLSFLEFILLFLPIWRVWDNLRDYCINFYTDDIIQRTFLLWILVLAVSYGINAPYAFVKGTDKSSLTILIGIYLVARASFLAGELLQCIFLPFLRRQFFFKFAATSIAAAFWISSIWAGYPAKIGLLVIANFVEHPINIWLYSPMAHQILTPGYKRNVHIVHFTELYEGFFIIILGEGVFRLIEGSPTGAGINGKSAAIVAALLMYYLLHWLYFNGDRTKEFVHALRRTWWKPVLWQM
jgi:low temperature requirement protein LtrA